MAAATKKSTETQVITIQKVQVKKADITIVGDTPLIVHAWSEKAKREMLDAQQKLKKDKKAKEIRLPANEFVSAAYWLTPMPELGTDLDGRDTLANFEKAIAAGAKFGFPITAIKQSALAACYRAGIIPNQMGMKCSFYLNSKDGVNLGTGSELAVIQSDKPPVMREDMVKIGGMSKVADLRYRPMFTDWRINLTVSLIDVGVFTMDSIINAINLGGYMGGIGEWRMERDGDFGHYHVEVDGERV